jgi:hypothetical protein
VSRYNYPLTGVTATSVSSLPVGTASLFHQQASYSSLAQMSNAVTFGYHNTADPFVHTWNNNERPMSGVVVAYAASQTQGWALSTGPAVYQGNIQILTQSAPPALPVSQVIGVFKVMYHVLFRNRD